ncbi:MAG: ATP-binding protein [Caldilinea sp. CFX5]|nr:ATP-binding protein [Caldilinea sp. CFX5]
MVDQVTLTRLMQDAFADDQKTGGQSMSVAPPLVTPSEVSLEIPAALSHIHLLSRCACALAETIPNLAEPVVNLYNLELAIQEVAVNIVNHAYAGQAGRIRMCLQLSEQPPQLTLWFHDTGGSFDPTQVPAPHLGALQEHGFGLFLVRELMDEVDYQSDATGNCWTLVKHFPVEE